MTMGKIIICRADEVARKTQMLKPAAVLSIEHPGVKEGEHGSAPRLADGTPQKILTFWDSETPVAGGPDIAQVEEGILYIVDHLKKGDVIVHCHAGKSRSVALALGALSILNPSMDEEQLVAEILKMRPIAAPNIIVVGMVDQLTGWNGKLLTAVETNKDISRNRALADAGRRKWRAQNPETYKKMHPEKFPKPPGV